MANRTVLVGTQDVGGATGYSVHGGWTAGDTIVDPDGNAISGAGDFHVQYGALSGWAINANLVSYNWTAGIRYLMIDIVSHGEYTGPADYAFRYDGKFFIDIAAKTIQGQAVYANTIVQVGVTSIWPITSITDPLVVAINLGAPAAPWCAMVQTLTAFNTATRLITLHTQDICGLYSATSARVLEIV